MYAGRIVEQGPVRDIFRKPLHPYTQGLLASIPGGDAGTRLRAIEGTVPNLAALPPGCTFAPRCPYRMEVCTTAVPALVEIETGHQRALLPPFGSRGAGSALRSVMAGTARREKASLQTGPATAG